MRLTPTRKLAVVNAVFGCGNQAVADAVLEGLGLPRDEVEGWRDAYEAHGLDGLYQTKTKEMRA